jgi:hypothetical protein
MPLRLDKWTQYGKTCEVVRAALGDLCFDDKPDEETTALFSSWLADGMYCAVARQSDMTSGEVSEEAKTTYAFRVLKEGGLISQSGRKAYLNGYAVANATADKRALTKVSKEDTAVYPSDAATSPITPVNESASLGESDTIVVQDNGSEPAVPVPQNEVTRAKIREQITEIERQNKAERQRKIDEKHGLMPICYNFEAVSIHP